MCGALTEGSPRERQQHEGAERTGRGHSTPALAFLTAQQNKPNAAGQVGEQWRRSWEKPACVARVLLQGHGGHLIALREAGHRRKPRSTAPPEAQEEPGMLRRDTVLAQTPGLRPVATPWPWAAWLTDSFPTPAPPGPGVESPASVRAAGEQQQSRAELPQPICPATLTPRSSSHPDPALVLALCWGSCGGRWPAL